MSVIKLPEGCELGLKVYLAGTFPDGTTLDLCTTLEGMTAFGTEISQIDANKLVKDLNLGSHIEGATWRVMTRDEIKAYKGEQKK